MPDESPVPAPVLPPRRNRGGRPWAEEPSTTVSAWIPSSMYDRLAAISLRSGESISSLARGIILAKLNRIP